MVQKFLKKLSLQSVAGLICVVLSCLMIFLMSVRIHAKSTGSAIGTDIGTAVGKAVGSFQGLVEGKDAWDAGKEAGLHAEDITVAISNKLQEVQKLEVLAASGTYSDLISVGDDYAAILSLDYKAIFTVDLGTAQIELLADGLRITLDQPLVEFVAVGDPEKRDEYIKGKWTGSVNSGYEVANNAMNAMKATAEAELQQDEGMMQEARVSAEEQLVALIKAASITKTEVYVNWREKP